MNYSDEHGSWADRAVNALQRDAKKIDEQKVTIDRLEEEKSQILRRWRTEVKGLKAENAQLRETIDTLRQLNNPKHAGKARPRREIVEASMDEIDLNKDFNMWGA